MEARATTPLSANRPFPRGLLGSLDASVAEAVVAAGGDVAMIIDRRGVICDMAVSNETIAREGAESWLDQRWTDTVAADSRHKVDELLRDALSGGGSTRWREINQITPKQDALALRYVAVDAGREGHVIAIGRDDRATAQMQQRLLEAQQALERDYARLRDAEFRYRLLFQLSGEAVIVVDAGARRIVEANPAAERFVGGPKTPLVGEVFSRIFDPESQDGAASLLTVAQSTSRTNSPQMRLFSQGRAFIVSVSLFRQDRSSQCLVRLTPEEAGEPAANDGGLYLQTVLERMPDPFVLTDDSLNILSANTAFLDLARVATREQAQGQPLNRFLGRAGLERNILVDTLRAHGVVRNFATVLRNLYGDQDDVEVSAVVAPEAGKTFFGFTLRTVGRRADRNQGGSPDLRRSVEQLTELVGRVTLKELVRETTDLVERLCIEAALELTGDNRASAAEVLGLSRQSLYSKLHRFGIGNLTTSQG